jgi:hypothetical protein
VALRPGWLNRQFDQVSKNVDSWPDWMKRAAGFEGKEACSAHPQNAGAREEPRRDDEERGQQPLRLST